ncbi:c-type cytochrome [Pseudopedobacter beijingensis]|uniref:C-type cytochrome n=1 Tax=Pseudopedobacter beijingensis TaxID=1207056 RepID=A0ABW4IG43_9SPHI
MKKLLLGLLFIIASFAVLSSCSEDEIKYQRYYSDGMTLYKDHCQSCHMADGTGLRGLIPPLTDTAFLQKNRKQLTCIIKYGLQDTIMVNGEQYSSVMPAESHLTAIDIAKILTYITNSFGNQQGIYDVTEVEENLNKFCK